MKKPTLRGFPRQQTKQGKWKCRWEGCKVTYWEQNRYLGRHESRKHVICPLCDKTVIDVHQHLRRTHAQDEYDYAAYQLLEEG